MIAIAVATIQAGTIRKRSQTTARPLRFQASPLREGREFFRDIVIAYPAGASHMRLFCLTAPGYLTTAAASPDLSGLYRALGPVPA